MRKLALFSGVLGIVTLATAALAGPIILESPDGVASDSEPSGFITEDGPLLSVTQTPNSDAKSAAGTVNPVPEPATLLLVSAGLIGAAVVRRGRKDDIDG